MSTTLRHEGRFIDPGNYIIQTAVTITAGTMVWLDPSGTNVVHRVENLGEATAFAGILTETLTGPLTGRATIATEGVYRMIVCSSTEEGTTGVPVHEGSQVFAVSGSMIRGLGTTAATLTSHNAVGVVYWEESGYVSGDSNYVWVKIFPFRQLEPLS